MTLLVAAAFGVSLLLTAVLCRTGHGLARLDTPNERSLHTRPTPRTGGLAILAAVTVCGVLIATRRDVPPEWIGVTVGGLMVAFISFLDDRSHVPALLRLSVHLAAGAVAVGAGMTPIDPAGSGWYALLASAAVVLAIAWMTNLFNFMDGMDGFAGGMAVIGFATCAWIAGGVGALVLAAIAAIIAAASAGFLVFNLPPARIFLGDAGASTLGFLAAMVSIAGIKDGVWPAAVPLLVFSPFIVDATVTLLARLLRGEKVWRPHRTHYYQRLVCSGWGHPRTLVHEYAVMLACAATAVLGVRTPGTSWMIVLAFWACVYLVCMLLVHARERRLTRDSVAVYRS